MSRQAKAEDPIITVQERLMSTLQAVIFGMMLSWTPSVVLLAWLLWREGIFEESAHKENARRRSLC